MTTMKITDVLLILMMMISQWILYL